MKRKTHYHFITRVLVIIGIVAALPLSMGFLLIQHSAKTRLSDAAGTNFVWFAQHAVSSVDVAFLREVEFLSSLARSPVLVRELEASNGSYSSKAAATGPGRVEEGWEESAVEALLSQSSSRYLAGFERASPLYREIVVLEAAGGVVAASGIPERPNYASQDGFKKALARARAKAETGASWAEAENHLLTLYRPIREPDSGEVLGMVRAAMDTERLFRGVSDFRFGETGRACLLERDSGRVLAGSSAYCSSEGIYPRREQYERASAQGNAYFLADVRGPASFDRGYGELVAYARLDLSRSLPELDWVVVVEQSLAEAHAPLSLLSRDLIVYFLGMGALVVLLAGYLSFRLEKPTADIELDLHHDLVRTTPSAKP